MKKILLYFLFISYFSYCQEKKITLPKGYGFEINFSNNSITPILKTYVTKNGKITFENINLPIDKLGDTVYKYRNKQPIDLALDVQNHIYADKKTPYKYIDAIKYQLRKGTTYKIVYRTDEFNDITKGIPLMLSEFIEIRNQVKENENNIIIEDIPLVFDPAQDIIIDLYNLKFNKIIKTLKNSKYVTIRIYHKNKIIINDNKISLKDEEKIYKTIKNSDFYFVFTDKNLCYEHYIKNISLLTKIYKSHKKQLDLTDIPLNLEQKLKENKFKL